MENYKKKYEEAMLRMNKWVEGSEIIDPKEVAEFVFPELKESEDERVRKALTHYFSEQDGILTAINGSVSVRDILAWLEKQGEIKRQDYPYIPGWRENRPDNKPKIKHSILMLTTHGVAEGEWLGEEWCQYRWSCKIKDTEVLYWLHLSDLETIEKGNVEQGEQKPADKVEAKFKIGDTIAVKYFDEYKCETIKDIKNGHYIFTDGYSMNIVEQEGWRLVKTPTIIEQNPAWGEDDEYILNLVSQFTSKGYKPHPKIPSLEFVQDWLKSLKGRVQPQPTQEWSKEDETSWNNTMIMIKECAANHYTHDSVNLVVTWLNSIKGRMKGE